MTSIVAASFFLSPLTHASSSRSPLASCAWRSHQKIVGPPLVARPSYDSGCRNRGPTKTRARIIDVHRLDGFQEEIFHLHRTKPLASTCLLQTGKAQHFAVSPTLFGFLSWPTSPASCLLWWLFYTGLLLYSALFLCPFLIAALTYTHLTVVLS